MRLVSEVGVEGVVVLLAEALTKVAHVTREVAHGERLRRQPLLVARASWVHHKVVSPVGLGNRRTEALIAARGSASRLLARLVKDAQDAGRDLLDQVDAALVVLVLYARPPHPLFAVQILLSFEDKLEEELLQLLVREVDAKLRKWRGRIMAGKAHSAAGSPILN